MDDEDKHSPSEVNIILNIWKLLMQKLKQESPKASQEAKDDFINQQKSANTDGYWYEHWLFSATYTLKLMVWKLGKLKAYLRPSLTTFCRNLLERTEEKRRRLRTGYSFQFSAQCKLTVILRRNIHLTYPRTMGSKNPDKSLQRSELSHLFWHEQQGRIQDFF